MENDPSVESVEDPLAEADKIETAPDEAPPELVVETPVEAPRAMPSDTDVQNELSKIASGLVIRMRLTIGDVTDTYVVGGDYAPGRQRWVQTSAWDSAFKQAAALAAALN